MTHQIKSTAPCRVEAGARAAPPQDAGHAAPDAPRPLRRVLGAARERERGVRVPLAVVVRGVEAVAVLGRAEQRVERGCLAPWCARYVLDERRNKMIAGGNFNLNGFRLGWTKSCVLFIVGLFLFGKANFLWILVGAKLLHDWRPDLIPGPKELGLFKIWGIV